ncbi:MAG: hypothetical protein COX40_04895 [Candidatus Omnitrophica bacterium CG23_combo_of_CG06-09_8_20_14_all_40_11]|nr:MAG: hypothetical protein COX40_04895 [Candidatus Omnitrophica bacterium CG23_combo_of_CG06-09_8_20_14_all_40_11]
MGMFRLVGLFAIIPTTVLLTISFFVLYTLRRTDTQGLKAFGYVIAALLWLSALLVFSAGVYTVVSGHTPMECAMHGMMKTHMQEMMESKMLGAMSGQMPAMMHGKTDKSTIKQ